MLLLTEIQFLFWGCSFVAISRSFREYLASLSLEISIQLFFFSFLLFSFLLFFCLLLFCNCCYWLSHFRIFLGFLYWCTSAFLLYFLLFKHLLWLCHLSMTLHGNQFQCRSVHFSEFFYLFIYLLFFYSFRVFHISVSWWFFSGVWVTANLLMSPGLVSGFWPFSAMLSFG